MILLFKLYNILYVIFYIKFINIKDKLSIIIYLFINYISTYFIIIISIKNNKILLKYLKNNNYF